MPSTVDLCDVSRVANCNEVISQLQSTVMPTITRAPLLGIEVSRVRGLGLSP